MSKLLVISGIKTAYAQLQGAILELQGAALEAGEDSIAYEYVADAIKACNDAAEVIARAEAEAADL